MIRYFQGDATEPIPVKGKIPYIMHICNDIGAWGSGFVCAISAKWKAPEKMYKNLAEYCGLELGTYQVIRAVGPTQPITDPVIVNIIGQHETIRTNELPIRYWAVHKALKTFSETFSPYHSTIHMPRMGTGLAGGLWEEIEHIIINTLIYRGFEVFVYDLPSEKVF